MSIEERLTFIEDALARLSEDTRELLSKGTRYSSNTSIQACLKEMRTAFREREAMDRKEKLRDAVNLIASVTLKKDTVTCGSSSDGTNRL